MPNKRFNKQVGHADPGADSTKGAPTGYRAPLVDNAPVKTAAWPGVPGNVQKAGQRDKSGTTRIRTTMKKEGC